MIAPEQVMADYGLQGSHLLLYIKVYWNTAMPTLLRILMYAFMLQWHMWAIIAENKPKIFTSFPFMKKLLLPALE